MAKPRDLADTFVAALRAAVGDRLRAAALFGSAARDEWIEGISDVNVLVLLDRIDAGVLERAAPAARTAAAGGVAPLLMEVEEWHRAADVFAIEVADMKEARVPLHGDDPVASLQVDASALRLQAERELRGKLLHLHGAMLMTADDPKRLGQILVHALPSFSAYLRAALRLANTPVPRTTADVIAAGARLTDTDPAPFTRVLDARSAGGDLELRLSDPLADQFNRSATTILAFIDNFGRVHQ